jgi:DHA2 family multidrug resistance protein
MWMALASLQYFLEEGAREDWFDSRLITAVFLVAIFSLIGFVIRELTAPVPAVDLRLFKDPMFMSGSVIGGLMFAMLMANMFLLPIFMQELLGFSAVQAGFALMPRVMVMMIVVPIVGRLYTVLSPQLFIGAGVVLFSVSSWMLSGLSLESGTADVIIPLLVQGAAFACLFVPLTTIALNNISREKMADATGLSSLIRQIGGAIGLAVFATMLSNHAVVARGGITPHISETRPEVWQRLQSLESAFMGRGMDSTSAHSAALRALDGTVTAQSTVLSFDHLFVMAGGLFLLVLPLLFLLRSRKPASGDTHEIHLEM